MGERSFSWCGILYLKFEAKLDWRTEKAEERGNQKIVEEDKDRKWKVTARQPK